jgi:hypothetical protein
VLEDCFESAEKERAAARRKSLKQLLTPLEPEGSVRPNWRRAFMLAKG